MQSSLTNLRATWLCGLLFLLVSFTPATAEPALLIYGGSGHKTFLGCLNTGKFSANSIWNQFGQNGSQFSATSIWNQFSPYGGKFSNTSPFNPYATDPPVIVDANGNFYGYLTANKYFRNRTRIESALFLVDNYDWIKDNLDEIRDRM